MIRGVKEWGGEKPYWHRFEVSEKVIIDEPLKELLNVIEDIAASK